MDSVGFRLGLASTQWSALGSIAANQRVSTTPSGTADPTMAFI
jgi:hypothetical protein